MPQRGWESVTVPGAVSAWVELSSRFGRLPFETLFEPAIGYAREGYHVSPIIASLWKSGAALLSGQPGFADCFMPGGRVPAVGELFRNLALADSLQDIALTKGASFYQGRLAERIAAAAAENGAVLTLDDLAAHRAEMSGTISTGFRDVRLHEIPPNTQGVAALIALGVLEHTDIAAHDPDSAAALHLQIEAIKLGLADAQRYVADLSFMRVAVSDLLDPDYLKQRAALIDPARALLAEAGAPKQGGTVYVTAADQSGMMIRDRPRRRCRCAASCRAPRSDQPCCRPAARWFWRWSIASPSPRRTGGSRSPSSDRSARCGRQGTGRAFWRPPSTAAR